MAQIHQHGAGQLGDVGIILHQQDLQRPVPRLRPGGRRGILLVVRTVLRQGQVETHRRALARRAVDGRRSAALAGEAIDLRQAQPRPLADLLGGEEGLEAAGRDRLVHAHAGVVDGDADIGPGRRALDLALPQFDGGGLDADDAALGDGVAGVDHQVHQGRVELAGIQPAHRLPRARGDDEADRLADRVLEQGLGLAHEPVDPRDLRLEGLAAGEGEKLLGETLAAAGGGQGGLDHAFAPRRILRPPPHQVEGADDDGQEVVEVVRHPAGQLADGLQALRAAQGDLGPVTIGQRRVHPLGHQLVDVLQIGLDLLGVGDIVAGADEAAELALRPETRTRDGADPSPLAVGAAIARLQDEGLARGLAGHLILQDAVVVVGVQPLAPIEGEGGLIAGAEEVGIGLVDEFPAAVGMGDPHEDGDAVGQGPEARLALAQLRLGAATFRHVDVHADGAPGAVGRGQDLAPRQQPPHRTVGADDPVLHRLEPALAGLLAHLTQALAILGMCHPHHRLDVGRLGRIEAEIAVDGAGPVGLSGLQVPVPHADAAGLLGQLQPRLGLVERPADLRLVPPRLLQTHQRRPQLAGEPDRDHAGEQVHDLQGQGGAGAGEGARPEDAQQHGRGQGRPAPAAAGIEGGGDEGRHIGDRHAEAGLQPDEGEADQHAQGEAARREGQGRGEAWRLAADEGEQPVLRRPHRRSPWVPSAFSPASGCI